jgi:hypothetical protein
MTQNIYDNESFFAVYSRLPRSVEGLDGAPEWPTLRAMLPEVSGRRSASTSQKSWIDAGITTAFTSRHRVVLKHASISAVISSPGWGVAVAAANVLCAFAAWWMRYLHSVSAAESVQIPLSLMLSN